MKEQQFVFMKPSNGPCDIHDWPTDGLARRLIESMQLLHRAGGVNACRNCIARAKQNAEQLRDAMNSARVVR